MSAVLDTRSTAPLMKLADALRIVSRAPQPAGAETFTLALVCSFTPLHLQTFVNAELRLRFPHHDVKIVTGLYDDMCGTLRDLRPERLDAVAIVLEWFDLDARLGLRRLGGWSPKESATIVERAQAWLAQFQLLIAGLSRTSSVVISLPTLPLPPVFCTGGWQAASHELRLREALWTCAAAVAGDPRVRIVSEARLSATSPMAERLNVKSTWLSGFPYQTPHAARLAELLTAAIANPPPKKGLITDLDGTLWNGVVGDDGVQNINWDLDHHSQAHGVYQQFLSALSEEGVLVGVASKNDPRVVEEAFAREDLLVSKDRLFPFAVTWGSKAQAVTHVLKAWNVSGDSIVFVDDNPAELAEVKAAHPAIECIQFPAKDPDAVFRLLVHLRDLFGKTALSQEDRIRLDSLRSRATAMEAADDAEGYSESLLEQAQSEVVLDFLKAAGDSRSLELINKTNQFNLNGRRITDRSWAELLEDPRTFLLTASYKDRFGPLGKIAVLAGRVVGSDIHVDTWVMSCRAFGRRIEHQCLSALFDRFAARAVAFDYVETPRNGPLTRLLREISGSAPSAGMMVTAESFRAACPRLFHRVTVRTELGHV